MRHVFRLAEGSGLDFHHIEVFSGAALLAVDVLEAFDGLAVGRVATDSVGEIGFGACYVGEMVDANFCREIEQLGRFGLVGDGLGARLV